MTCTEMESILSRESGNKSICAFNAGMPRHNRVWWYYELYIKWADMAIESDRGLASFAHCAGQAADIMPDPPSQQIMRPG